MLVACRLAGLSALRRTMRASNDAQCGADALSHRGLARGVGGGSRRVFRFRTASCDFIRHAEEAVSPPASFDRNSARSKRPSALAMPPPRLPSQARPQRFVIKPELPMRGRD